MGIKKCHHARNTVIMINYGKQDISDDDVNSVVAVLRSDFLTQGPAVPNFEKRSTLLFG